MRLIDLSAVISASPAGTPEFQATRIDYLDHSDGANEIAQLYGVGSELLRDGEGWTRETLTLGTHNSTHVDAPYHYNSRIGGKPSQTIDQLPLEWFFGPGVVLDVRDLADGEALTVARAQQALATAGHRLAPRDIVLVHTGRDQFYAEPDYIDRGPGVRADATRWLHDQGVRVMGIDAWGWDRPLRLQADDALSRRETGIFWEAHQAGLAYSQIERLTNLGALPSTGFRVACFPLKVAGASAAPARVVAFVDD